MMKEVVVDKGGRVTWVDMARGVAIILVVLGHIISNGRSSDILATDVWKVTYNLIYSFHMPLFFFISGYLSGWTNESPGLKSKRFLRREVCLIVPYVAFCLLYLLFKVVFAGGESVVHPQTMGEILYIGIKPIGEYWFLYALIVFNAVLYLVDMITVLVGERFRKYLLISVWIIGIVYAHINPLDGTFLEGLDKSLPFLHYFIAGCLIKEFQIKVDGKRVIAMALLLGVLSIVTIYFKVFKGVSHASLSACAAYATIGFIVTALQSVRCGAVEYLGANTMPIYLLHVFAVVAFKVCWTKLGINSEVVFVLASTIVSTLIPLLLYKTILQKIKPIDFLINTGGYLPKV